MGSYFTEPLAIGTVGAIGGLASATWYLRALDQFLLTHRKPDWDTRSYGIHLTTGAVAKLPGMKKILAYGTVSGLVVGVLWTAVKPWCLNVSGQRDSGVEIGISVAATLISSVGNLFYTLDPEDGINPLTFCGRKLPLSEKLFFTGSVIIASAALCAAFFLAKETIKEILSDHFQT